ncbi:hypothetical protein ACLMAL_24250 [Nocardia sp. CWNU-33]|uniref:hypothetical protein n=1 Tax=Nocardia sp. CWNU-33 TaxID=3392117 RepID=UPI00398E381C
MVSESRRWIEVAAAELLAWRGTVAPATDGKPALDAVASVAAIVIRVIAQALANIRIPVIPTRSNPCFHS